MKLFKQSQKLDHEEIHNYIDDLKAITVLRDKASGEELVRYNKEIEMMLRILEYLLEKV